MTDRPILFSGAMVRALVAGEKTQTRRVLRTWNGTPFENLAETDPEHYSGLADDEDSWGYPFADDRAPMRLPEVALWQYVVGDRLWVRETFRPAVSGSSAASYRATLESFGAWRWKPGIHMPRALSRLTLLVTAVRVERLQGISEDDAWSEGIRPEASGDFEGGDGATGAYRILWDSLNAKRGFGWDANPWVVAVTFTVHRANIDTLSERIAA
ncbi:hypothetical protein ACLNGM_09860 [Aureimonas phyllosphaerae]|uniref:hypothetical protein n=1 Tax=Aureimonas phyllosphaerae TaxID=1166078 RepID=UPI003A5BA593